MMMNERTEVNFDEAAWSRVAARLLKENFADESAIETANYQLCGFILAAAELALEDTSVAERIGRTMEGPRSQED